MKSHSKKSIRSSARNRRAFTLIEVVTAMAILGIICAGVMTAVSKAVDSGAQTVMKLSAFEVARENMEKLLTEPSVGQKVEYGVSEKYPAINWETNVESFFEPITSRMWIQATCSATYLDDQGVEQSVELTHWITNVSKEQVAQLMKEEEKNRLEDLTEEEIADLSEEELAELEAEAESVTPENEIVDEYSPEDFDKRFAGKSDEEIIKWILEQLSN